MAAAIEEPVTEKLVTEYMTSAAWDHENITHEHIDLLDDVENAVNEIKMAIEQILEDEEDLEHLQEQTVKLEAQAEIFEHLAEEVEHQYHFSKFFKTSRRKFCRHYSILKFQILVIQTQFFVSKKLLVLIWFWDLI